MDKFYEKLNISENCLANQTIFKKTFLESVDLLASDKKLINDHIKKVVWKYCFFGNDVDKCKARSAMLSVFNHRKKRECLHLKFSSHGWG